MLDHVHIRLFSCRFVVLTPERWRLKNIQDSFWRFYANNRDGAFLECSDGCYPLCRERLYIIPAGVRFDGHLTHDIGHFYVHFDMIGLPYLARRELFCTPVCLPHVASLEQTVREIMQELEPHKEAGLVLQFRAKAVIYEGLALYLRSLPTEQLQRCLEFAEALEPVLPAIRHIEANLSSRLLSSELAQMCHMNVDYFTRRFRECVGQTPVQYIQEQRVKLAAQQLLFTDLSIEQIAA
ncbi:MAG TPA: AraC family transcriptional regulator, partial [Ktedonobacteraceae bacterium]|nr:AraC family transcriptional regulator [Ktedonobacteraceae bacterium]